MHSAIYALRKRIEKGKSPSSISTIAGCGEVHQRIIANGELKLDHCRVEGWNGIRAVEVAMWFLKELQFQ
jgi:hypothetical protein